MRTRTLGRTGVVVSEIGFGAWGIGGRTRGATSYGDTSDAESRAALRAARDHGITFFDTSNLYGAGHSETLLGAELGGERDRVVLATKAGRRDYGDAEDWSPVGLRTSLEGSLRRLRTDWVDLLQLHNPPLPLLARNDRPLVALARLRAEGKVRAIGISVRSPDEGLVALETFAFDVIQVNLNLLDQRAVENGLLAAAAARGIAIIARTPLCFGLLTGTIDASAAFDPSDHRSAWPREQILRWIEGSRAVVAAVAARAEQTPAQVALRFCLSHPAVASAIPGMLHPAEVAENAAASALGPLGPDDLAAVAAAYRTQDWFVARAS